MVVIIAPAVIESGEFNTIFFKAEISLVLACTLEPLNHTPVWTPRTDKDSTAP